MTADVNIAATSDKTLPPGWAWATVGEVAEVRLGRQRSPDRTTGVGSRPYLRAANVTWQGVDLSDVKEMDFTDAEATVYELHAGDILLNEASGSADEVGKSAIYGGEIAGCCFQNTLIRVRVYGAVTTEFAQLCLYNDARAGRFVEHGRGIGIHHLGAAKMHSWPMPVPPLAEQRRIVAALDEALGRVRAARASLDEAPALLERARQAVLAAAFRGELTEAWRAEASGCNATGQWGDYPQIALDELTTQVTSGSRGWSSYCGQSGTARFVRVGDLNRSSLDVDVDTAIYVTPPPGAEGERTRLAEGDVLISITADVGMIGLVPHHPEPLFTNQHVAMCRLNKGSLPRFVAYALKDPNGAQRTIFGASYGATKASLSLKQIRALTVPLPPLAEQHEIVRRVDAALAKLDAVAAAVEATRAQLDAIERAVLAKAFRGELVAQDAADEPAAAMLARLRESRAGAPTKRGRRAPPLPRVETHGNEGKS
jgi:type I restriction enzyme S subunit